ncbi:nucleotidyltransferase family protein [Paenibacillus sp. 32352]|uniref:nucleotidyltransferase family protein n=1 Tax=Paenibacillus sp. 32352 TaxID=1969111 RepID=UPI0009AC8B15|nr:hypothetical protein [Paenibacillus sp. 32352]
MIVNVIDSIIENRNKLMEIVSCHGVTSLKIFGSVLARTEKPDSNIDFIAVFNPLKYEWGAHLDVQYDLETIFNRKVTVINWSDIPETFKPTDAVDIMQLEASKRYDIIPKTSLLYFVMLDHYLKYHDPKKHEHIFEPENRGSLYRYLAKRISWWFSRLLLLEDNDLRSYEGFDFVEVLYLCDKLEDPLNESPKDVARFKQLFLKVRDYVHRHCPPENDELMQFARVWVGNRSFDPFEEMD